MLNFLAIFLKFCITRWVGTKRNETKIFISIFLILFQPILAWNEFIIVFFNFLNFIVIFLEFSITCQVKKKRHDNFYFLYFSSFSYLLWLEMKPQRYFLIFLYFFATFLKFSITQREGTERNDNFFSLFLILFQPSLAWNELIMLFFNFWIFMIFFWNFLLRIG